MDFLATLAHLDQSTYLPVSARRMQICPQTPDILTESVCAQVRARFPDTRFRLHANVRITSQRQFFDLSLVDRSNARAYFRALAKLSSALACDAYSLHAGYCQYCRRDYLPSHIRWLEDVFSTVVLIEGLYPSPARAQHISTWADYRWLLDQNLPYALDLSHLNIVAHAGGGWDNALLDELLLSELCQEVHIAANDGNSDKHSPIVETPPWHVALENMMRVRPHVPVFSEERIRTSFS